MAKLHTTEAAVTATRIATQIFGGYGFMDETPGGPLLPRRQDPRDRRGHQRDPAPRDQPRAGPAGPVSRGRADGGAVGRRASGCSWPSAARSCWCCWPPPVGSPTCTRSTASCRASQLGSVLTEQAGSDEPRNFLLVGVDSAANLAQDDPARDGSRQRRGPALGHDDDPAARSRHRAGVAAVAAARPVGAAGERRQPAPQQRHPERWPRRAHRHDRGLPRHPRSTTTSRSTSPASRSSWTSSAASTSTSPTRPATRGSGLDIEEAGCVTLDGQQALVVRALPPLPDLPGRALAERRRPPTSGGSAASRTSSCGRCAGAVDNGVRNPVTLDRLVNAGLATVTVDDLLTADDIIDLGRAFRGFDPGALDLYSLPVVPSAVGGASDPPPRRRPRPSRPSTGSAAPTRQRPAPGRRPCAGAQRLRRHRAGRRGRRTTLAGAGFGSVGRGRGGALRLHRDGRPVRGRRRGQGRRSWPGTSIPVPALELVEGPLGADVVVVTGQRLRRRARDAAPAGPGHHRHHDGLHRAVLDDDHDERRVQLVEHHLHHRRGLRARGAAGGGLLTLGRLHGTCQNRPAMDASRRSAVAAARPEVHQ